MKRLKWEIKPTPNLKMHNTTNKITCWDCGKEIEANEKKELINGFELVYDIGKSEKKAIVKCKECYEKDPSLRNYQQCEVYSRVVGYLRPVQQWNKGKKEEFKDRKDFNL